MHAEQRQQLIVERHAWPAGSVLLDARTTTARLVELLPDHGWVLA
jgi:hypothetical protein